MVQTPEQLKNIAVKITQAVCDGALVATNDGRRVEAARVKNGNLEIFVWDGENLEFSVWDATDLEIATYVKKEVLHVPETEPEKEAAK
ncbi:MAG: hypothetical protein IJE77_12490 [Thermoguttaceae bacterium]|nr:hypothetical protein [Thermoguttaceae bacterium]MBQ9800140.1 hypothetical protein [Thermoguttaceae bacterium]